ncbi:MAG: hypothetical protein E7260_09550 [Lachnospiraceae bacterium]|nr:hypothetical protein [Lachnospiraceae bacterium]
MNRASQLKKLLQAKESLILSKKSDNPSYSSKDKYHATLNNFLHQEIPFIRDIIDIMNVAPNNGDDFRNTPYQRTPISVINEAGSFFVGYLGKGHRIDEKFGFAVGFDFETSKPIVKNFIRDNRCSYKTCPLEESSKTLQKDLEDFIEMFQTFKVDFYACYENLMLALSDEIDLLKNECTPPVMNV